MINDPEAVTSILFSKSKMINRKFYHLQYMAKTFFCQEKNSKKELFYFKRADF